MILSGLDCLYVVGALDEALNIRGFRYHPGDIESTVVRCHKNITGRLVGVGEGECLLSLPHDFCHATQIMCIAFHNEQ